MKLISNGKTSLKNMRNNVKNARRNVKRAKYDRKKSDILNSKIEADRKRIEQLDQFHRYLHGFKNKYHRPTTCGYKLICSKAFNAEDEDIFSTFIYMSLRKAVRLVNDSFIFFYGNRTHCTSKPIVVNWKNGTVRKLNDELIIGWGAGRSAKRQCLQNNNFIAPL